MSVVSSFVDMLRASYHTAGLTALLSAGLYISYASYQDNIEKQLHVYNATKITSVIQLGFYEGWIDRPAEDEEIQVSIQQLRTMGDIPMLRDPSGGGLYDEESSFVRIEKEAGNVIFYIKLKKQNIDHVYIKDDVDIIDLTKDQVTVP
ncbi:MAG: hypothetical protein CL521_05710 [Actinobacteria bacterium]|nr:hypothetical protein [Actinomycetota bacterium]|tara:strand:+ start:59 stop:502 length:444 start_codon:yes stop_codon:yes gene_type:complete